MTELVDVHEVLIEEHEILEREYDQLKLAKSRSEQRLKREIFELRSQLRQAVLEVEELQTLLAKAFVRT